MLAVRAVSEDLHMSVPLIAITVLPAAQEASKNVHKLVQEVWTERKVECVWVALFKELGNGENQCHECFRMSQHVCSYSGARWWFPCALC